MSTIVRRPIVRRALAALAIAGLVATSNGCGPAATVTACPQRAWAKGWIDQANGLAKMEVRQSFNWNSTGLNGACTGYGTQWVGVNESITYTYCRWEPWFPYYADCNHMGFAENRSQNDYKSSDGWGEFDWNVWNGSSGRVNIHTYVQGFKSGNAHTHCWMVAIDGPGKPWGRDLECDGGNS
jgi:hypothetical protein